MARTGASARAARKQIGPAGETKTARQGLERFPIFRHGVGLLFGLDLQPMLDPPQKPVGRLETCPRLR